MERIGRLILNPSTNQFASSLKYFLSRQVHLKGNLHVIDKLKTTWNVSMGSPLTFGDTTILYDELFRFNYDNEGDLQLLKTYLLNGFIAQFVENFETLIKNLLEKVLEIKPEGEVSKKFNRRMFGSNREIIDIVKAYLSTNVDNTKFDKTELERIEPIFLMLEQVRHIIVHSDQVLKEDISPKFKPIFDLYFSTMHVKGEVKLMVDVRNAEILNAEIAQFGFEFFRLLSQKHGFPIGK